MAVSRKRKHAISEEPLSGQHASNGQAQQSIKAYAKVRKSQGAQSGLKKRKTGHDRDPTPPPTNMAQTTTAETDKKRKRTLDSVAEESDDDESVIAVKPKESTLKHYASTRSKRVKNTRPPSPTDTPSKDTAALFDRLRLDSAIPFSLGQTSAAYDTPPETPTASDDGQELTLPNELQDLCQLHASFLAALSLYYAHNGASSPVNVKALLPQITATWKRRNVILEDLRRLLAVKHSQSRLALEDFGRAGVCLVRKEQAGRIMKHAPSYMNEEELNGIFQQTLQQRWSQWQAAVEKENCNPTAFLQQLAEAEIRKNESAEKAAPLFTRGQQRLADLKAGHAAAQAEASKPAADITADQKTAEAVQSRGTHLLDRILARQAVTATLPAGPTKQQLERKAALHRIEEIARVLDLLAGSKPRCSLSMQAMVQQLHQSLRNPISREEVERCLDLMAKEITPGFVNVVISGTVKAVVVCRTQRVGLDELRQRVKQALA